MQSEIDVQVNHWIEWMNAICDSLCKLWFAVQRPEYDAWKHWNVKPSTMHAGLRRLRSARWMMTACIEAQPPPEASPDDSSSKTSTSSHCHQQMSTTRNPRSRTLGKKTWSWNAIMPSISCNVFGRLAIPPAIPSDKPTVSVDGANKQGSNNSSRWVCAALTCSIHVNKTRIFWKSVYNRKVAYITLVAYMSNFWNHIRKHYNW